MHAISPLTVDASVLTATNVVDIAPAYVAGTTYADAAQVTYGTRRWTSLQGPNLGHTPGAAGSEDWWQDAGVANPWAMFDASPTTQSTAEDEITVEITLPPGVYVDGIAGKYLSCSTVHVVMTDPVEGVVYDVTVDQTWVDIMDNWKDFLFGEPDLADWFVLLDAPPYAGALLSVTFSQPGETVACGVLALGRLFYLGDTQWAPRIGIDDYSVKGKDEFNNDTIVERPFSDTGDFTLNTPTWLVDKVKKFLTARRAKPTIFIGDERFGSTVLYAYPKEFEEELADPTLSTTTLQLEGLGAS